MIFQTVAAQSVTEFTILNGRVTVTRAANDARNDVNVTIVANGRRNELRSVNDLKDNIHDATDNLLMSRRKLHRLKDEFKRVKEEVNKDKNKLLQATVQLCRAVHDLHVPQLYSLNEEETDILRYDLHLAEAEILAARRRMQEADDDLNLMTAQPASSVSGTQINEEVLNFSNNVIRNYHSAQLNNATAQKTNRIHADLPNKCSVCLENSVNAVLYKCGHMCTCYNCAVRLHLSPDNKKCPVCRTEITDVIRTYLS
ncbi:hypothetical protein V9T40_004856 [Parthenolecanium corni]|uniref:RING-type domain-containing protein n=1 Tax=Parthenolecanium corni TaxID=536013 RepID=A0AAN9Y3N9_9HEMI